MALRGTASASFALLHFGLRGSGWLGDGFIVTFAVSLSLLTENADIMCTLILLLSLDGNPY